ncbi:MAG: 7-cyano-7-deazaguanine synthase QueC [Planctomycetes bacterium]|nr:7-cyano-7-deazaguanine synthase QueC [Planctomycetota bacterium]
MVRESSQTRQGPPRALVLASGGLDSSTTLAIAMAEGFAPLALTFRYGQSHVLEVERAKEIAGKLGVWEHLFLDLPYAAIGGSALLGDGKIPAEPPGGAGRGGIPATYVPARNLVFLALGVAVAEARGLRDIYIGANAIDFSGYPDCRPAFFASFSQTANLATRAGVSHGEAWFRVHTPLLRLKKSEIIRRGYELAVDFARTISCYDPDAAGRACGRCDSCGIRRRGFQEAGLADPTPYRA